MNQIKVTGMILSSGPVGEYDRRVVLLTRERGKLSAFAKGARRPNSALAGAVSPFFFGEFFLYEGRSSYTIKQAKIQNYFRELREDLSASYYGLYCLELADYYCQEGSDETAMLGLLYQTAKALAKGTISKRLIRCVYELRVVWINGESTNFRQCMRCGKKETLQTFSLQDGGMLCNTCSTLAGKIVPVCGSALYALQYIISAPIKSLYIFAVSKEVLGTLEKITAPYLKLHTDRAFKTEEILEVLRQQEFD